MRGEDHSLRNMLQLRAVWQARGMGVERNDPKARQAACRAEVQLGKTTAAAGLKVKGWGFEEA